MPSLVSAGLFGLELTELSVPSHANLGHSITLYCWFNLGDASLYSVKWYKDEFEFFRFMPDNKPEMQVFPLAGIMLDVSVVTNVKLYGENICFSLYEHFWSELLVRILSKRLSTIVCWFLVNFNCSHSQDGSQVRDRKMILTPRTCLGVRSNRYVFIC